MSYDFNRARRPAKNCMGDTAFSFAKGDQVEALGSKVRAGGKEVIVAREITKDKRTLVLRNGQGVPQWSGGRRNR